MGVGYSEVLMNIFFLFLTIFCAQIVCMTAETVKIFPIHEAFIPRNAGLSPQEVIGRQPPAPIAENPPPMPNQEMIWIPGYWKWIHEQQDFVPVCGTWRLPPPDRIWNPGYWKELDRGWTWVFGDWIEDPQKYVPIFSQNPPPSPQNEDKGSPPDQRSFWLPGYWEFDAAAGSFRWLSGSWQSYDPAWIFTPAHWIWRPDGYYFVSSYWDWTLNVRGVVYDCGNHRQMEIPAIAQQLLYCYPDYLCLCSHYWHYYPHYWDDCGCVPPWWSWNDWWSLPCENHWWLWWWWMHPSYPAPNWLHDDIILVILPPSHAVLDFFSAFPMPWFITPFGVPTFEQWLDAIGKGSFPFLFPKEYKKVLDGLGLKFPKPNLRRPGGQIGWGIPKKPVWPENLIPPQGTARFPKIPEKKNLIKLAPKPILPAPKIEYIPSPRVPQEIPSQEYVPEHRPRMPHPQFYPPEDNHWWEPTPERDGRYDDDDRGGHRGKGSRYDDDRGGHRGKGAKDTWNDSHSKDSRSKSEQEDGRQGQNQGRGGRGRGSSPQPGSDYKTQKNQGDQRGGSDNNKASSSNLLQKRLGKL